MRTGKSLHRDSVTTALLHRHCTVADFALLHRAAPLLHRSCTVLHHRGGAANCTNCTGAYKAPCGAVRTSAGIDRYMANSGGASEPQGAGVAWTKTVGMYLSSIVRERPQYRRGLRYRNDLRFRLRKSYLFNGNQVRRR